MISLLRQKNLVIDVCGRKAQMVWIRNVVEEIYEVSVQYIGGDYDEGYHTWYVKIVEAGECEFIACSMYQDEVTEEIRKRENLANPGKELLAKLGFR